MAVAWRNEKIKSENYASRDGERENFVVYAVEIVVSPKKVRRTDKTYNAANQNAYMPHLSILYGDLTEEEKKKAQERGNSLDEGLSGLSFRISSLALYKTDTGDKTLKSWQKISEFKLKPN